MTSADWAIAAVVVVGGTGALVFAVVVALDWLIAVMRGGDE